MAYDITDPKHERHHEVMSDLWDNRDKTERRSRRMEKHRITLDLTIDPSKVRETEGRAAEETLR